MNRSAEKVVAVVGVFFSLELWATSIFLFASLVSFFPTKPLIFFFFSFFPPLLLFHDVITYFSRSFSLARVRKKRICLRRSTRACSQSLSLSSSSFRSCKCEKNKRSDWWGSASPAPDVMKNEHSCSCSRSHSFSPNSFPVDKRKNAYINPNLLTNSRFFIISKIYSLRTDPLENSIVKKKLITLLSRNMPHSSLSRFGNNHRIVIFSNLRLNPLGA